MTRKKKITLGCIGLLLAGLGLLTYIRWEVWFGNPPEAPYTAPPVPSRVLLTFGNDLTRLPATLNYEVAYLNGVYVFAQGDHVLLFDGENTTGVYNFKKDRLMVHNLKGRVPQQPAMERQLKAIIQSYMQRMLTDQVAVK